MKLLTCILLAGMLAGCQSSTPEEREQEWASFKMQDTDLNQGRADRLVTTVIIDGCEYIYDYTEIVCHKGNCKNHRQLNNNN